MPAYNQRINPVWSAQLGRNLLVPGAGRVAGQADTGPYNPYQSPGTVQLPGSKIGLPPVLQTAQKPTWWNDQMYGPWKPYQSPGTVAYPQAQSPPSSPAQYQSPPYINPTRVGAIPGVTGGDYQSPPYWRPQALGGGGGDMGLSPSEAAAARVAEAKKALGQQQSAQRLALRGYAGIPSVSYASPGWGYGEAGRIANDMNYAANQQNAVAQYAAGQLNMMPAFQRARLMGSPAGGAGVGGASGNNLYDAFQKAMDDANRANEQRYQDTLAGTQNRYERNMNYLEGAGQQEARDINQAYAQQAARTNQDLINRGLRTSTIASNLQAGNERERLNDQGRLQERLRQQRIATDAGLSGDVLSLMERRNDIAPDMNQLIALAQLEGRAGPIGGGYAGVPMFVSPGAIGYGLPSGGFPAYVGAGFGGGGTYANAVNGGGLTPSQQTQALRRGLTKGNRLLRRAENLPAYNGGPLFGSPLSLDELTTEDYVPGYYA